MMNVDNERVEPETDLGLALAPSSRCMPNTRSSSSGAGVNATSMVDLTFVATEQLSELVWSPHYGLRLKCAEKKPSIFGDAGLNNNVLSPTGGFVPPGPGAAHFNGENQLQASFVKSRATVGAMRPVIGSSHGYEEGGSNNQEDTKDVRGAPVVESGQNEEDTTPVTDVKGQCSSKNVQFTSIAETAENYADSRSPKTVDFFPVKANDTGPSKPHTELLSAEVTGHDEEIMDSTCAVVGGEQVLGLEVGSHSGLPRTKQIKDSDSSSSNSTSPEVNNRGLQLGFGEEQESKVDMLNSTYLYKMKGKEKALSDAEPKDENSHESVESCNSGGVFLSGRKRPNLEQQLTMSKRPKTKTTAIVTASIIGQDSSFMNWISNMMKGLNKMGDDEPPVSLTLPAPVGPGYDRPITRNDNPRSSEMGFQTIFQSIYKCGSTQREVKTSNQDSPIGESNMSGANISPIACYGENAVGCSSPPSCDRNKKVGTFACIKAEDGTSQSNSLMGQPEVESVKNNLSDQHRNHHRGSLWITRLSQKAPAQVLKSDASTDCTRTVTKIDRSSEVSEFLSNPALNVEKMSNPEAMTSVFAKRVDALKHIASMDTMEAPVHTTTTCFYCGRSGHNMSDCSEMTESEREILVKNVRSNDDGVEDLSPSLCIRCFQPDHWAISCPARSKFGPQRSKEGPTLGNRLNAGNKSHLLSSCSGDRSKVSDMPRGLFDSVKKLQLSRTDILKWMNSYTSLLHLNGYFLRLRLAKSEGGTGYCVGCIAVDQGGEKSPRGSRKPISVDIGGTKCLVESQYISNQDFLEEELKAWWKSSMASGGKIPSPDNLVLKLEEKQKLGI